MATKQYLQVGCNDVEPSLGCGFQARCETEEELFKVVGLHAGHVHKLDPVPQELADKVKKNVKSVSVEVQG